MSSDNAQSAVTYTSISSNSYRASWGIPLINAGEFPEIDPYKEVAQQGQVHPLSPAYVPNPMELDEHMSAHVLEPEHSEYHAPSDDDIQVEDGDKDPEEDPSEEHELEDDDKDPKEDPNKEHEPEDENTREPSEGSDETEPFKEDETAITPPPPRHHGVRISVRPQAPMIASTQALIDAFTAGSSPFPLPPTSPAYDQVPLESSAAAARAPRSQAEDVGYDRALQASERRMMTSIEEVNLRVSYQAQVRRQKSEYFYTHFMMLKPAADTLDSRLMEMLARLEILETHMSRMKWQRQSAEDLAVTQMMRIHTLKARARTNTVEDTDISY
nr:hypothetical protein [Tanacetum cinerariifolium]